MKKQAKMALLSIIILLVISALGYLGYLWYSYASALKKQSEKWLTEEFKPLSFNGIITEIEKDDMQDYFITLHIKTENKRFSYGLCAKEDKDNLINFLEEGDSITKNEGNTQVVVIKRNGEKKKAELPFCN
jgi:flagellar basal body-associated protein FliL